MPPLLGVNIDHVATLRQARYARTPDSPNAEPCPVQAGLDAIEGGADSLTFHVRADRRHMQPEDVFRLKQAVAVPLNLEMGVTEEMVGLALKLRPEYTCLVPESRMEITTEGGLDVRAGFDRIRMVVARLQDAGIKVSLFIDPDPDQVEAAGETCAEIVELHTGCYANATGDELEAEFARLATATELGIQDQLQINAGHGINYDNITRLLEIPGITEFNIGHSIVSRAMRCGMSAAVREMKDRIAGQPG
jgi:pyridoxine 5-phosphate synthase